MTQAVLRSKSRMPTIRLRLAVGLCISLAGLGVALQSLSAAFWGDSTLRSLMGSDAVLASALAGAATGLGAIAVLALRRFDHPRGLAIFMALSAGMMFSAAALSLLAPAVRLTQMPGAADALLAATLGYVGMALLDRLLPHLHAVPVSSGAVPVHALRLMVVAIAVHNLPEGFAVGASFGGGDGLGWGTALSIGLQNIPEGLIVATALWSTGLSRTMAVIVASASGLLEPLGAAVGTLTVGVNASALPWALALAGGAMVFVVVEELIPEAFKGASPRAAPLSFTLGFFGMAALLAGA
ncbi:MAG: ZIP family metal transporter [Rubrivivax sp.]|nr:ZIP family metal transporter [Rubrivivax sp.]